MKTITLGYGLCALVDDDDYARALPYTWFIHAHDATVYARCNTKDFKKQFLHRFVVGESRPGFVIDHINGKGYDCRRSNLRWVTIAENNRNFHPCEWKCVERVNGGWGYVVPRGWRAIGCYPTAFAAVLAFDTLMRTIDMADLCHFPPQESVEYARTFEDLPRGN